MSILYRSKKALMPYITMGTRAGAAGILVDSDPFWVMMSFGKYIYSF